MFYDFHRTSRGRFAIFATVTGSCSERVYTQVGRNYMNPEHAALAACRMAAAGQPDVTLKNINTKQVYYFTKDEAEQLLRTMAAQARKPKRKGH